MADISAVTISSDHLPTGYESVAGGSKADQLAALGRALLSSPTWPPRSGAVVVDRRDSAFLVLAAEWEPDHLTILGALGDELASTHVRYLDYSSVEELVWRLGNQLRGAIGDLSGWRFAAVPRGGLIVLGALAYALELDPGAITQPTADVDKLVLVDDCAISGVRLDQVLSEVTAARVVVATLLSPSPVRAAIVARHRHVTDAVSAEDLPDRAPQRLGDDYEDWRRRWEGRGDHVWIGRTDHVAFPWNEPDLSVWDETKRSTVAGWRLVPPERCMKNRRGHDRNVGVFVPGPGPIRHAPAVVDVSIDHDTVVVVDLDSGRTLTLGGVGAAMWRSLVSAGTPAAALADLRDVYDIPPSRLERDLTEFMDRLSAARLIDVGDHEEPA